MCPQIGPQNVILFLLKEVLCYFQIDPLYKELHAYVRYKLRETYPEQTDERWFEDDDSPIPAHLLGIKYHRHFLYKLFLIYLVHLKWPCIQYKKAVHNAKFYFPVSLCKIIKQEK